MVATVSKGRKIYFAITITLILDRLFQISIAVAYWDDQSSIWQEIVLPAMVIGSLIWLWEGENFLRWVISFWTFMKAYLLIIPTYQVSSLLYSSTPAEQKMFFWQIMMPMLQIPILWGCFYLVIGLTLSFSRSLKLFFDYQAVNADDPFWLIWRRFTQLTGLSPEKGTSEEFLERFRNRKRHEILTELTLEHTEDHALSDLIHDHVSLLIEQNDYEHEQRILQEIPDGQRAVYLYWWLEAEITNGGFHQYFFNKGIDTALQTLEGLKLLEEIEVAQLLARAIDIALREEDTQLEYATQNPHELIANYVQVHEQSSLPDLDSEFYDLDHGEAAIRKIRKNPQLFIS